MFYRRGTRFIALRLQCGLVFLAIGTPRKGLQRVTELLLRMRRLRWSISPDWNWQQRLRWETQMCDELRQLQKATNDARHRQRGANLVLDGLRSSSWKPTLDRDNPI